MHASATIGASADSACSECPDHTAVAQPLPWQPEHQRVELRPGECDTALALGPVKPALVQAPTCEPHPEAVMDQHLQARAAPVAKEIGVMRLRLADTLPVGWMASAGGTVLAVET